MKPFHISRSKVSRKIPSVSSHYLKLWSRFSLYFFLLVALPCIIASTVTYLHVRSVIAEKVYNATVASIAREKTIIDKYISELKLAVSASTEALTAGDGDIALLMESAIDKSLAPAQKKALSAVFLIRNGEITASYGTGADKAVISSPLTQQWYFDAVSNPGTVYLPGTVQRFFAEGKSKAVFCMAESMSGRRDELNQAVLLFDFNYSVLSDFGDMSVAAEDNFRERIIMDYGGNVLYSREPGKLTATVDTDILKAVGNDSQGFKQILYNNRSCYMSYVRYPDMNWIFIDLNPVSNVTDGLWLRDPSMIACLIVLPVLLFIYLSVTLRLLNPINELTAVISDFESQQSGAGGQYSLLNHNNMLGGSVNGISDIDYLINKVYNIKLKQKEAELNSLQNQINPHFLYNTLESIRGAALYHGIHDIAAMSKALSLFFRYSIGEKVLVSIKEEVQHLDNYMSIQNFRYENKFELLYSIPQELMNYKILKLTLQPLVENSIKHGLEMKLGRGTIRIEMLSIGNSIKIQISDDGLGMPPKKIDELNKSLSETGASDEIGSPGNSSILNSLTGPEAGPECGDIPSPTSGIGIKNVNSRIKLYFGRQYGLKYKEVPVGTMVEITLPAIADK